MLSCVLWTVSSAISSTPPDTLRSWSKRSAKLSRISGFSCSIAVSSSAVSWLVPRFTEPITSRSPLWKDFPSLISAACCKLSALAAHQHDLILLVTCCTNVFYAVCLLLLVWSMLTFALFFLTNNSTRRLSVASNQSWCFDLGFSHTLSAVSFYNFPLTRLLVILLTSSLIDGSAQCYLRTETAT